MISFVRHIPLELSYKKMLPVTSSINDLIPSGEPIPGGLLFSRARFRFNSTLKNNQLKTLLLICPNNGEAHSMLFYSFIHLNHIL